MTMVVTMVAHGLAPTLNSITDSDFEAKCLALLDEVARTRHALVITKNGKPVATLAPYGRKRASLAGLHRDDVEILGEIVAPLDEPWEADA